MPLKVNRIFFGALILFAMLLAPTLVAAAPTAEAAGEKQRFIAVAKSSAEYDTLRSAVQAAGGKVLKELRDSNTLVVTGTEMVKNQVAISSAAKGVAIDQVRQLVQPSQQLDMFSNSGLRPKTVVGGAASAAAATAMGKKTITGDPAITYPGLLWNLIRIHAPEAWQVTTGAAAVRVGVADTGLDFTHSELAPRIVDVVDFTVTEDPPICKTFFGLSDADLAMIFGGPEKTDWNGHGSWIGGNIAATLDGLGTNGIAPNVKLVALKISQWCGSAFDSEIIDAIDFAAANKIDIVSISFGGYSNLGDPNQALAWVTMLDSVQRARQKGTIVVAAAGNEHVEIGPAGLVLSHGPLTNPTTKAADFQDLFGLFESPGGIPGVVDVSSTGNFVAASTPDCLIDPKNLNNVCKSTSDPHQQSGVGKENQLSYFSNYGPRIDVAGPGGARKFNLPFWDAGGTPGFPYTSSDLTTAFEDFSTTSNWAVQIPCFVFTGGGFPANQCYSTIQGTSMSTPHASGVLALIASENKAARHNPDMLERILKQTATKVRGNTTQVLSATDHSADDLTGKNACAPGYCHLGGEAVSDAWAYGAGLVDAGRAVKK